jgi:DNA-binding transcriptional regulator YiaG
VNSDFYFHREEIRRLRQNLRMTQEDFAHEIGVTFATVNRWENGRTEPKKVTQKVLKLFAKKHKVSLGPTLPMSP